MSAPIGVGDPTEATPPASVPLGFLAAAGAGVFGFGFATWFAADRVVVAPSHPGVVSAVHLGVLAFLTTAVIGALHQFGPVAGRRPLRSTKAGRLALVTMVATAWMLPNGFAHGPEWMVLAGGLLGALTVTVVAWNLSGPLSSRGGGVPVAGLRLAVAYLVLTVGFGVVYVINRRTGWFPLLPNRVMAHAHLGLLGWLGLAYVSVSEKLWPMFLLSHRPSARSGGVAVAAIGAGVLPLAFGLLLALPQLAWLGGAAVVTGLGAHLVSLASCVRHRRRPLELLHGYLFSSATFLIAGVVFGVVAAFAEVGAQERAIIVAAEVGSLMAWLALAVMGHSHKIVPFIVYSTMRARGVAKHSSGRPLLFGDLYRKGPGWAVLVIAVAGFGSVIAGTLVGAEQIVAVGGAAIGTAGVVLTANLALGPRFAATAPSSAPRRLPVTALPRKESI